jgi:hypothetical protein
MPNSDNKPEPIEIDKIVKGVARVLIRWNAREVPAPVMDREKARTQWEYDEEVIQWSLPTPDLTPDQIAVYFKEKQAEVEGFAKAKRTNWKRTDAGKIDIDTSIVTEK